MHDKVCVHVRVPAEQRSFEFRLPYALRVGEVVGLVASLLEAHEDRMCRLGDNLSLMVLDGTHAGTLLQRDTHIEELVESGLLMDGSDVALV